MASLLNSLQPQPILAARFASFASQRTFGYALSRELPNRTRQDESRFTEGAK